MTPSVRYRLLTAALATLSCVLTTSQVQAQCARGLSRTSQTSGLRTTGGQQLSTVLQQLRGLAGQQQLSGLQTQQLAALQRRLTAQLTAVQTQQQNALLGALQQQQLAQLEQQLIALLTQLQQLQPNLGANQLRGVLIPGG